MTISKNSQQALTTYPRTKIRTTRKLISFVVKPQYALNIQIPRYETKAVANKLRNKFPYNTLSGYAKQKGTF